VTQFIKVNPAGSYLSDASSGDNIAPTRLNLSDYGVSDGQILVLTARGDYAAGEGWYDDEDGLVAVFVDSSGSYLAPDVYLSAVTSDQWSGMATDIPEDFRLPGDDFVHVRVPTGASAILFSVEDSFFKDNHDPDGDFGVTIDFNSDGTVNGAVAVQWFKETVQGVMLEEDGGEAFAFFELVNWSILSQVAWDSVPYLTSDDEFLTFRGSNGESLQIQTFINASTSSGEEKIAFLFKDSLGNALDWSLNWSGAWGPRSESNQHKVTFSYVQAGNPSGARSDTTDSVRVLYSQSFEESEAWGEDFASGSGSGVGSWEISKGDSLSGYRFSVGNVSDFGEWFWSPSRETESWGTVLSNFSLQDFGAQLNIKFSVDVTSLDNGTMQQFNFRDLDASYRGKTYEADSFEFVVGEDEFDVDLTKDLDEMLVFFRTEFLDRIQPFESSGSSNTLTPTAPPVTTVPAEPEPSVTTPSTPPSGSVGDPLAGLSEGGVKQVSVSVANESFIASAGEQKIAIPVKSTEVSIQSSDGGKTWTISGAQLGTDTLAGFKRVQLTDATVALDFSPGESGHAAATIIGTAFGKDFVGPYFGAGAALFDSGKSKAQVSKLIVDLGLIESLVGPSDQAWVRHVYKNVVGADPDPFTEAAFVALLQDGSFDRTSLLALAADVPLVESQINLAGLQTTGLLYSGLF
jgi:hypothetical protein